MMPCCKQGNTGALRRVDGLMMWVCACVVVSRLFEQAADSTAQTSDGELEPKGSAGGMAGGRLPER